MTQLHDQLAVQGVGDSQQGVQPRWPQATLKPRDGRLRRAAQLGKLTLRQRAVSALRAHVLRERQPELGLVIDRPSSRPLSHDTQTLPRWAVVIANMLWHVSWYSKFAPAANSRTEPDRHPERGPWAGREWAAPGALAGPAGALHNVTSTGEPG